MPHSVGSLFFILVFRDRRDAVINSSLQHANHYNQRRRFREIRRSCTSRRGVLVDGVECTYSRKKVLIGSRKKSRSFFFPSVVLLQTIPWNTIPAIVECHRICDSNTIKRNVNRVHLFERVIQWRRYYYCYAIVRDAYALLVFRHTPAVEHVL